MIANGIRVAHVASIDLTLRVLLLQQLRALRDAGFEVTAISAGGPSVPDLEAEGIRHIAWGSISRSWDPWSDLRAFRELIDILRVERFDLVHTHNAKPGVMGRVAARLAGIPCVLNTVHGFDARPDDGKTKRLAFMSLEWMAARFSDVELYQSAADLARARRLRMKRWNRCALLGNGIDLEAFDPTRYPPERVVQIRRELGIAANALVVGTTGRLVGDKGYRELFAAARQVHAEMPDVVFLVVGDRDPGKQDALTAHELAEAARDVVLAGWREDVPDLIAAMDVFVLPTWREGFPRSPMEAAAMGLPLVLSDIPGCREVARHGVEVVFVPPRDPTALAHALVGLLRDTSLRERLGAAARRTAIDRFDQDRVAEIVVQRSREVLARKGLLDGRSAVDQART